MSRLLVQILLVVPLAFHAAVLYAQGYPAKPLRFVSTGIGASTDLAARTIAPVARVERIVDYTYCGRSRGGTCSVVRPRCGDRSESHALGFGRRLFLADCFRPIAAHRIFTKRSMAEMQRAG
jgi:hypothetical protein